MERVTHYHGLDVEKRVDGVTYLADAQDMHVVQSQSYDFALAFELLEHVPHPNAVLDEIHRILRPGGRIVISAPHLSRMHETPNDFFRFTEFGLRALVESAGFQVLRVEETGGLFAFLGHQVLIGVASLVSRVKPLLSGLLLANRYVMIPFATLMDRSFGTRRLFPLGHVLLAFKP